MNSTIDIYKRIEMVCKSIPCGKVATYGQIALLCGMPTHSRQVGYALNKRLTGVPAHRVVNHQGLLTGASSFQTPDTQKNLLKKEGIKVNSENKIDLKKYAWTPTAQDALNFHEIFLEKNI